MRRRRQWSPDARALGMIGDRWLLLIVRELAFGPRRLSELQRAFPGLSTGALEQRLGRMTADGLILRERYAEVPPRVQFELTDSGRDLLAILAPVARWALRWAWTEPNADEWVDVAAIIRLAACVATPPADLDAELELIVENDAGVAVDLYTLAMGDGRATVLHRPAASADAVVTGASGAWVAAFGPERDRGGLRIAGDAGIAELFLESLAAPREGLQ